MVEFTAEVPLVKWVGFGLSAVVLLQGVIAANLLADGPSTTVRTQLNPTQLVRQLGDPDFRKRRQAERDLLALGAVSLPAVQSGLDSSNAEIRYRSRRLADELQLLVAEQNVQRLQEQPWQVQPDLYRLWERWQLLTGDSPSSRALLSRMLSAEPKLLMLVGAGKPLHWRVEFENRCSSFRMLPNLGGSEPNALTAAAILFVAVLPETQPSTPAMVMAAGLVNSNNFMLLLKDPQLGPAGRSLMDEWLAKDGASNAQFRIDAAMRHGSAAAIPTARRLLSGANTTHGLIYPSIMYLARFGGDEAIEFLEAKLEVRTIVYRKGVDIPYGTIEVRDLALLALLHLTGQDPVTYGFDRLRPSTQYLYLLDSCALVDEAARVAALNRWRKWRIEHLRTAHEPPEDASEGMLL